MNTTINQGTRKKVLFFIDKHGNTDDNRIVKSIVSSLLLFKLMAGISLPVRAGALIYYRASLNPSHFFEQEIL